MKTPVRGKALALVVAVLAFLTVGSVGTSTILLVSHSQEIAAVQAVQRQQSSEQQHQIAQAKQGAKLLRALSAVVNYLEASAAYQNAIDKSACQVIPGCQAPNPPPTPPPFP